MIQQIYHLRQEGQEMGLKYMMDGGKCITSVIKLNSSIIRSNLCHHSDAYIHITGTSSSSNDSSSSKY